MLLQKSLEVRAGGDLIAGAAEEAEEQLKEDDDLALEEALQKEMFDKVMEEQRLSKGQRINIGSPDTYFRPVYATAAGVKSAPEEEQERRVQGRLQVISTSVLADPEHMEQMNRQFHHGQPRPAIDASTAAAAVAAATAAVAESSAAADRAASSPPEGAAAAMSSKMGASSSRADNPMVAVPFQSDVIGPNPFQGIADVSSVGRRTPAAEPAGTTGQIASAPVQWKGTDEAQSAPSKPPLYRPALKGEPARLLV
jgi:hypothetical protein